MKRFTFSDSSTTLLYPHKGEFVGGMLEGLEYEESMEEMNVKKKRLSAEQVKALEQVFEEDRQLDPERKVKIAQETGLQPKQVAIWFQNRRARHKTKQMERDYTLLKANYEALHLNYTKVEQEKEGLIAELKGLKQKIGEENNAGLHHSAKEPITINLGSQNQEHRTTNYAAAYNTSQLSPDSDDSSGVLNNNEDCSLNILQLMHKISTVDQRSDFANVEDRSGGLGCTEDSCNIFCVDEAPDEFYW
ncbi:PREDICTED: homeobox-leucine zipper protein ATHB-5-like [Ipomoea nil]|uniref:homeobox-leucine zipper protein ATHB-5-like n=1 Tax=Ipomoea nil TaxID=35883 RepID=UPI0009015221|nr:PREDICTED: homeobox-leucine zipper protein ATHB-5-like [Ipomoea nil]